MFFLTNCWFSFFNRFTSLWCLRIVASVLTRFGIFSVIFSTGVLSDLSMISCRLFVILAVRLVVREVCSYASKSDRSWSPSFILAVVDILPFWFSTAVLGCGNVDSSGLFTFFWGRDLQPVGLCCCLYSSVCRLWAFCHAFFILPIL